MCNNNFIQKTKDFFNNNDIDFGKPYYIFDTVDSTNRKAKDIAEQGGTDKSLIVSQIQQSGRGRLNRGWESPPGGLYFSVILRPTICVKKTTLLPLVASVCVAKTLRMYGLSACIKWPNDIRINRKKIAGILLESNIYQNKLEYIILGIGVNLNTTKHQFSEKIRKNVTSVLSEHSKPIDYYQFLRTLLDFLDTYYRLFINDKYPRIISDWKELSDTLEQKVKIVTSKEDIIGKAVDIDEHGFIIIDTIQGEKKTIMSGDCFHFTEL
ncbi:MAG: biotin--[acetyl-CoA-carboxylase] ligase [Thermoplasmatota archaeon]